MKTDLFFNFISLAFILFCVFILFYFYFTLFYLELKKNRTYQVLESCDTEKQPLPLLRVRVCGPSGRWSHQWFCSSIACRTCSESVTQAMSAASTPLAHPEVGLMFIDW